MGTLDQALSDADSKMFNPPCVEVKHFSGKEIALQACDVTDRLLVDGWLISSIIYDDGEDYALAPSEAKDIGYLMAALFACRISGPKEDLADRVDDLMALFARKVATKARDIAIEELEGE
jgi:hypothetical protein